MKPDDIYTAYGPEGDARSMYELAKELEVKGDLRASTTAIDRAYGLEPSDKSIAEDRIKLLDKLSAEEHGIKFRYIPAG